MNVLVCWFVVPSYIFSVWNFIFCLKFILHILYRQ
nr:MAG TPA: hypothetical protein [Bacteriophage sp.]